MTHTEYTIDAAGKKLGRVASQAAKALMGKTDPSYTRHILSAVKVSITNAAKLYLPEKKRQKKMYHTYSGHPGGLKRETLGSLIARKGRGEALKRAIERMLPRNASRTNRMKRLHITE
ncbi:MAG: large subunit ribosomal protein L13 [Parcubacteria group bacterium Gr01-1014_8]|nr:MAG: large subunit ribosomal protein L13 [Parcubacteria group bacterium Gr01-1014_8]